MEHLEGMAPLAERYDGFIVDIWGVIHDGVRPYPGARACLARLRDRGQPVVLLSNAPRRADVAARILERMQIDSSHYRGIMTSGEAAHAALLRRPDPWFVALGRRVLHIGPDRDASMMEGLGLERAVRAADATFVLNTGPDEARGESDPEPYLPILRDAAARRLPMLCSNPDLEVIRDGRRIICAGLLARQYEQLGGTVRMIGKPYPEIYAPVRAMLGLPDDRVLAVGDALMTDMAGARQAGVAGCWVLGGIHGEFIAGDRRLAEEEAARADLAPVATVPEFRW